MLRLHTVELAFTNCKHFLHSFIKSLHIFMLLVIFVHNLNIFNMVIPEKFNKWKTGIMFRPGTKIRGIHMYRDFVSSCNGSFKRLSKSIFYDWLRADFDDLSEGTDARGLWFMLGDALPKDGEQISKQQLRRLTSNEFVDWFDDKYESLLYSKYHLSEIRAWFLNANSANEFLVTRQRFNKWVDYGVNYKGGVIEKKRDMDGIFIVIS